MSKQYQVSNIQWVAEKKWSPFKISFLENKIQESQKQFRNNHDTNYIYTNKQYSSVTFAYEQANS